MRSRFGLALALGWMLATPGMALEWALKREAVEICLPPSPSPSERFAAEELQTYLEKMSGVRIPVREGEPTPGRKTFVIGRHALNGELWKGLDDPDHYRIDASGDQVRIAGGYQPPVTAGDGTVYSRDWGILYGVYQVLEDQGLRWLRPEPQGEEVPQSDRLRLPDGIREFKPAFKLRWGVARYATPALRSATPEEAQWAALWALRNRCNVTGANDPRYGGSLKIGGGGHSYDSLVPRSLFKEKPEFFPLINGKRTPKGQICHSNPELQEYFANAVIERAKKNPQWLMTSIDPNDGGGWCECAGCRAMDDPNLPSGRGTGLSMAPRLAKFNNIIAEKVARELPNLRLYCLAYSQYTEAPTGVDKIADNLVIGVAPFAGAFSDYSRRLRDPSSQPNQRFLASVEGYKKLGATLYAREYLSYYLWPGPLPILWTMQDRFREYRNFDFLGVYSETHPCWGPQGIVLYFYLRLLWNPDLDLKAEMADYCQKAYGPAAEPMLRYYEKLEARSLNGPYFGSGGSHAIGLFTKEFLNSLAPDVEEARRKVAGKSPYQWRVETVLAGYEFARLYREVVDEIAAGRVEKAKVSLAALEDFYRENTVKGDIFDKRDIGVSPRTGKERVPPFLRQLRADLAKMDTLDRQFKNAKVLQLLNVGWRFQPDAKEEGVEKGWNLPDLDDSGWAMVNSGAAWQHQGFSNFNGTAWYRYKLRTPVVKPNQKVVLVFDGVDGDATVWLNGKEVGHRDLIDLEGRNHWDQPFSFEVTDVLSRSGVNTLVVRVKKIEGNGGIYKGVRLISADRN